MELFVLQFMNSVSLRVNTYRKKKFFSRSQLFSLTQNKTALSREVKREPQNLFRFVKIVEERKIVPSHSAILALLRIEKL